GESVDRRCIVGRGARNVERSIERVAGNGFARGGVEQRRAGAAAGRRGTRGQRIGQRVQLAGGHGERGGNACSRRRAGGRVGEIVGRQERIVQACCVCATGAHIAAARHERSQRPDRGGCRDFVDDERAADGNAAAR